MVPLDRVGGLLPKGNLVEIVHRDEAQPQRVIHIMSIIRDTIDDIDHLGFKQRRAGLAKLFALRANRFTMTDERLADFKR